jgi:hypothetical protein
MLHLLHVFQTPFHASLPYQGTRPKVDQIQSYASAAEQQAKEELDELLGQLQKKGIKVAAWRHFNLLGEYDFSEEKLRDGMGIRLPKLMN